MKGIHLALAVLLLTTLNMASSQKVYLFPGKFCGSNLSGMLAQVCKGQYAGYDGQSRVMTGTIVDECCKNYCDEPAAKQYCA